jgi:methylated-DNA-[protein]-cysteine S-methyltransferase
MPAVTYFDTLKSPLGDLLLTSDGAALTGLSVDEKPAEAFVRSKAKLKEAVAQMRAYLAGELTTFTLPLEQPGTPFQQTVWEELTRIPFGETISYKQLAERVRKPLASRAVGSANGRNQIMIVVPCHRVIASGGALGGYGGGLWRKQWLLDHERT